MRVLSIFGTRPEAIKLAPVIHELHAHSEITSFTCVTAQHREMLDQVLKLFNIEPDYDLDLMRPNQTLFDITARILTQIGDVLAEANPDVVLVQGDTTSAFVGALAAYYTQTKVGHVEAGLRTHDKFNPFPEEANRKLADVLTDYYFAPTERARQNLLAEGVTGEAIAITGNTVIDALLQVSRAQSSPEVQRQYEEYFESNYEISLAGRRLILVTGHRRESFGPQFESICFGLKKIAEQNADVLIVYPVHLNPNVQEPVRRLLAGIDNVKLIPPQEYAPFVWLMGRAELILTDSGGIQEEAPSLGKPVLVLRNVTERPEAVESGTAMLVGTESESIFANAQTLLDDRQEYEKMAHAANPFGDGTAAQKIVAVLRESQ